jgi:predicted site-specific integrase-resolvase
MFAVNDLMERYKVTSKTIQAWIASGVLRAIDVSRKGAKSGKPRWRIPEEALNAFEAGRITMPPPPKPTRETIP